ncbi:hypothetical protein V8F20_001889 [Naviculisporaceae sp. PSN 640]
MSLPCERLLHTRWVLIREVGAPLVSRAATIFVGGGGRVLNRRNKTIRSEGERTTSASKPSAKRTAITSSALWTTSTISRLPGKHHPPRATLAVDNAGPAFPAPVDGPAYTSSMSLMGSSSSSMEKIVGEIREKIAKIDESEGLKKEVFEAFLGKIYKRSK